MRRISVILLAALFGLGLAGKAVAQIETATPIEGVFSGTHQGDIVIDGKTATISGIVSGNVYTRNNADLKYSGIADGIIYASDGSVIYMSGVAQGIEVDESAKAEITGIINGSVIGPKANITIGDGARIGSVKYIEFDELAGKVDDYFAGKVTKEEALTFLTKEADNPDNDLETKSLALANRAIIYKQSGELAKARADAEQSASLIPKAIGGYFVLSGINAQEGKFVEAEAAISKAIANGGEGYDLQRAAYSALANTIDAAAFYKEFQENLFAAEEKYKSKLVAIKGKVSGIGRGIRDVPVITFSPERFTEINFEMIPDATPFIAELNKGDEVIVVGLLKKGGEAIITMQNGHVSSQLY